MEVVLSPGRFGDDGAPFQNEEIREWSHVDRLTGMLERARVETGRWKTLNQGAARSYGKVIDSRERNSADGSIVQRARRQVEVFQSEAPGRSVQVVRASQWSSSRVTDSSTTSPLAITSLAQKKNNSATPEKLVASPHLNKLSSSLLLSRDEAISERLSTLLGSFAHHISSSTVPLRRIDSKYATRTPISRRSTSNEDLVGHSEIKSRDLLADKESLRDSQNPSYQKIKEKSQIPRQIGDDEDAHHKVHEISVEREETRDYNERLKIHEITVEREASRDYQERLETCEDSATTDNLKNVVAVDEVRPTTNKAAIQLLPSSKANTTVVNLINDSNNSKAETMDIREGKRSNILSWVSPSSVVGEEITRSDAEETKTTTTTTTAPPTSTLATTTSSIPRRESRTEEAVTPFSPGRSVKRVGFCKTEIHFAADSGKVNIVETDEKPPPTNKFRRRKRNSLNGLASSKNLAIEKLPIVDTTDFDFEQRSGDNSKTKSDPNLHRGHTTSVNLGSDLLTPNEQTNREHERPTEAMVKPMEKDNNSSAHSASTSIVSEPVTRKDVCNVVCTDADNNQVLLKVVTTHEPTIARVEIDHLRNNIKNNINLPATAKKEKSAKKCRSTGSKKLQKEHTYVNVFTGSKRTPIYENYKVIDPNPKIIAENKIETPLTTDSNSVIEKMPHVNDTKSKASQPSSSGLKTKDIGNTKLERIKVVAPVSLADGKLSQDTELNKTLVGNKKARNKTKESKSIRSEGETCNINNYSSNSSRGKSVKEGTKNMTSRSSASSGERGDEFVGGNNLHAGVKSSIASKSPREATSAKREKKSELLTKQKPIEVVYQTAVYNMKNEKLKKPQKGKESKGPRYLNELICGAKIKRPSDSKTGKTSSTAQNGANNKSALQPIKHWK